MGLFFDPDEPFSQKFGGDLPHRHQNGKIQYVTFRLYDSLPACVLNDLKSWIKSFNDKHPKPWTPDAEKTYLNYVTPYKQRMLDNGYGSCVFKYKENRDILSSALFFKDEENYLIHTFVIMPNHVHLLIEPFEEHELEVILKSVKNFSARKINQNIGRNGKLWERESWDRLVRSWKHYERYKQYIKANPRNLSPDQYTLYIRDFKKQT